MGFGGMGPGMMGWGSSGQAMCSAMAGHIEGRLVFIKAGLKITQDQEFALERARYRGARRRKLDARALHYHDEPAWRICSQSAGSA